MFKPLLLFVLWTTTCSNNCVRANITSIHLENFINDLVRTWKLLLPTIIFEDEIPPLCWEHERMLCVKNDGTAKNLAEILTIIHRNRKQDGIIFVGNHEQLLMEVAKLVPSFFRSECPAFMPKNSQSLMKLRLDSNIIFFEEVTQTEYKLEDSFAVKGGPTITLDFGKWEEESGIKLQMSMNRWERRTDLKGAIFVNGLFSKGNWAGMIKDDNGTIIGTTGYYQEMLLYILSGLNVNLKYREYPKKLNKERKLLANGTWQGPFGMMQRGEIDVDAIGIGINLPRTSLFDYPIPLHRSVSTLVAGRPEGIAPNMWVYVRVFGVSQWSVFLALSIIMVITLSLIGYIEGGGS